MNQRQTQIPVDRNVYIMSLVAIIQIGWDLRTRLAIVVPMGLKDQEKDMATCIPNTFK